MCLGPTGLRVWVSPDLLCPCRLWKQDTVAEGLVARALVWKLCRLIPRLGGLSV